MFARSFDTRRVTKSNLVKQLERHEAEFGPVDQTSWQGEVLKAEWFDRLEAKLKSDTSRIQSATVIAKAIVEGRKMGKGKELADRIRRAKQNYNAGLDDLAGSVDQLEQKIPEAISHGKQIVTEQHDDIDGMVDDLRQLSNV